MSTHPEFDCETTAEEVVTAFPERVKDKHFVITGANSGLGLESARVLAKAGGIVVMLCRDTLKGEQAKKDIIKKVPDANLTVMECDLTSLASISAFAAAYIQTGKPIHVLLNNAGVMACPYSLTKDGFETQFGTNHVGHYHLTHLLIQVLEKTSTPDYPSRVVNLSSVAHACWAPVEGILFDDLDGKKHYNEWTNYGMSKLANVLFTVHMQKKMAGKNIGFVSLHPGVIRTNLMRDVGVCGLFGMCGAYNKHPKFTMRTAFASKTIPQGTATSIVCSLDPKIELGKYYSDCQVSDWLHPLAYDEATAERLDTVTAELIANASQK